MFAIETKYHGATNRHGSRISATVSEGSMRSDWKRRVYVSYPHDVGNGGEETHKVAAIKMCEKLTSEGFTYAKPEFLIGGATKQGYVFVFKPEAMRA